jgi:hypothetical protein
MQDHTTYAGGAKRSTSKHAYHLIHPVLLRRLGRVLQHGADRYGEHNWQKGIPDSRYLSSAISHLLSFQEGVVDPDHSDNLAAAVFNIMGLMYNQYAGARGLIDPAMHDLPNLQGGPVLANWSGTNDAAPEAPHGSEDPMVKQCREALAAQLAQALPNPRNQQRVYVSGPYSADTAADRFWNCMIAEYVGLLLMLEGHDVLVPHAATRSFDGYLSHDRFLRTDFTFIEQWATGVFYIGTSPGADNERDYAESLDKPIWRKWEEVPLVWLQDTLGGLSLHGIREEDVPSFEDFVSKTVETHADNPFIEGCTTDVCTANSVPGWVRNTLAALRLPTQPEG